MPKQVEPNPTPIPATQATPVKPGNNLRVLHTQLDSWPKGAVISRNDLPVGADVKRLISIGAVEEVDAPRSGDVPLGPDSIARAKAQTPDGFVPTPAPPSPIATPPVTTSSPVQPTSHPVIE